MVKQDPPKLLPDLIREIGQLQAHELLLSQYQDDIILCLQDKINLDKWCHEQEDKRLTGDIAERLWAFLLIHEGYEIIYMAKPGEQEFPIDVITFKDDVYYFDQVKNYKDDFGKKTAAWTLEGYPIESLPKTIDPYHLREISKAKEEGRIKRRLISWASEITKQVIKQLKGGISATITCKDINGYINRVCQKIALTPTSLPKLSSVDQSIIDKRWEWQKDDIQKCADECRKWREDENHPGWWYVAPPGSGKTSRIIFGAIEEHLKVVGKVNIGIVEPALGILESNVKSLIRFMTRNDYKCIVNATSKDWDATTIAALRREGIKVASELKEYDVPTLYCLTPQGICKKFESGQSSQLPELGVVFFDECHHYSDDEMTTWRKAVDFYRLDSSRPLLVAATATPFRRIGSILRQVFQWSENVLGRPVVMRTIDEGMRPQDGVDFDTAYLAPHLVWRLFDKEIVRKDTLLLVQDGKSKEQTEAQGIMRAILLGMSVSKLPYFKILIKVSTTKEADALYKVLKDGFENDEEIVPGFGEDKVFIDHGKATDIKSSITLCRMCEYDAEKNPQGLTFQHNTIVPDSKDDRLVGIFIVVGKHCEGTDLLDVNIVVPTMNLGASPRSLQFITRACRRSEKAGKDTWEVWDLADNKDAFRLLFPETFGEMVIRKTEYKEVEDGTDNFGAEGDIVVVYPHLAGTIENAANRMGDYTREALERYYTNYRENEKEEASKAMQMFMPSRYIWLEGEKECTLQDIKEFDW